VRDEQIEDAGIVFGVGAGGPNQDTFSLEIGEAFIILLPDAAPARRDGFSLFELTIKKRRQDLARQKRRADIYPRIARRFSALELETVGALLPDDLGAALRRRTIN